MSYELEHLQSSMMAALFDAEALPEALTVLGGYVGAPIAELWAVSFDDEILQASYAGPVDMDVINRAHEYTEINPQMKALPSMRVGAVTHDREYIAHEDKSRDTFYQEVIVPGGLGHMAGIPLDTSRGCYFGLALHKPMSAPAFSDVETSRFLTAANVCAPVFRMMPAIEARNARSALATIGEAHPAAVLRKDGAIIEHNGAFERLLARGVMANTKSRKVSFTHKLANTALMASLNQPDGTIGGRFVVTGAICHERFICSVAPAPHIGHLAGGAAAAIMTIRSIDEPAVLDRHLTASVFGLTPAECDIAARLIAGADIRTIARDRQVAEATVRTILKSILLKTETHSQVELVTRLRHFVR